MMDLERVEMALEAGLHYVDASCPGYRRVRRGKGFSYVAADGSVLDGDVRRRIEDLVIPPAWEEVWISQDPKGHIQATGTDSAGRKQYIYHPSWEEIRDEVKFDRMAPFGEGLAGMRREIDSNLRQPGLTRRKVIALAVAVLDRTLMRVGNIRYTKENESYGLTTLTCDHLEVDGLHVHLEFAGKGGAEHQAAFRDRRLAGLVERCQELAGQTLFSYEDDTGRLASVSSSDINTFLSESLGGPFSAKDVRTWGASALVMGELARSPKDGDPQNRLREAVDVAAERLGNTRAVCRSSYVHPRVVEAHENGSVARIWSRAKTGRWTSRDESALRLLLAGNGA